ncbi:acyl-CoA dehydrogenase family protein [Gordonia rhizosphera]|uniref:Putative oxidoreductase n=1 Tax=Gordonia rhizosphera NBRC 16068 TaxID=1108045 RepID=K6W8F6_9ACTN|nr:acyl-CoA dehydrogenase family protein [Gordonia rhizosphera]GAB88512.1 putative oxidoreductase [Gordonia rhizosphera NBRC 16068]
MSTVVDTTTTPVDIEHIDLISRTEALIPLLQQNAADTEEGRRVHQDNIDALEEAGLFRVSVPRRHGGFEADFGTWLAIEEALGRGDGSTAWAFSLLNIGNWFVGLYGEQAQDEIYGTAGGARTCGVFTPSGTSARVDGGWRVTGKWGFASGSWHANWAMVGFPIVDGDGNPDIGFGMVPVSDYSIEETWFVAGMSGSGSNTVVLEDVFVPDHRVLALGGSAVHGLPTPFTDEYLYQAPFLAPGCLILAGPQLGLARAALDLVIEKAGRRGISYSSYDKQTYAPTVQLAVAEAAAQVEAARALVYTLCAEVTTTVAAGRQLDVADRTRIRVANAYAIKTAREAIRTLVSAHGASSFANANPLQRIWRDSETASRHAFALFETAAEVHGKVLLGVDELPTTLL